MVYLLLRYATLILELSARAVCRYSSDVRLYRTS
jgi:hypothetical protein